MVCVLRVGLFVEGGGLKVFLSVGGLVLVCVLYCNLGICGIGSLEQNHRNCFIADTCV